MTEALAGYELVTERVLSVYFANGTAQIFTFKEGDEFATFPDRLRITHADTGAVETIFIPGGVYYMRLQTVTARRRAPIPGEAPKQA